MQKAKVEMICDRCGHTDTVLATGTDREQWGFMFARQHKGPYNIGATNPNGTKDLCPGCIKQVVIWYRDPRGDATIIKAK